VGTVALGATGMEISRVGYGAWAIGGAGWWHAWGDQDDEQSIEAIRRAVELGINWVDTAPIYGLGHSEEVVGRALQGLDDRPYVFTKASLYEKDGAVAHSLKRDSIRREVEASLSRLQLDAIDVYQVHWPDPDADVEEGWATFAEQEGIGVVCYSPMASGLLSGAMTAERIAALPGNDWRKHDPRFQEPELSRNLAIVARLQTVAERHGTTPGAIAVAWTLRNPAVHGSIVGFRRPDQVEPLLAAGTIELTDDDLATIAGE
jgi:aryl-alcohol dehydrogenase-like predicted oxidoreductase